MLNAVEWRRYLIGSWSWKRLLRSVLFVYGALLVVAVFFADALIFRPPHPPAYSADLAGLIYFSAGSNRIAAVYLPPAAGKPTLLYSHGNAEDLAAALPLYEEWNAAGLGVLAYDFPGYGLSTGRPSESSCEQAAQAAWDYLTLEKKTAPREIVIAGRSVGGGPAVWLADREHPRALVLASAFTSAFAVRIPFPLFPGDRFPNLERVSHLRCPLLIIHGEEDSLIRISHGRALFKASPAADKRLITVPGAGHDDVFDVAPELAGTIAAFAIKGGSQ